MPKNVEPDLLKQVLDAAGVADHFLEEVAQPGQVEGDQLLEGGAVAGLAAEHE